MPCTASKCWLRKLYLDIEAHVFPEYVSQLIVFGKAKFRFFYVETD
jgi:hypothetical protein